MNELLHKTKHETDGSYERSGGAPDLGESRSMRHSLRGMDYDSAREALAPVSAPPVQLESSGQSPLRSSAPTPISPARESSTAEGDSTIFTGSGSSSGNVIQMEPDEEADLTIPGGGEDAPVARESRVSHNMRGTGGKLHTKNNDAGVSVRSVAKGMAMGFGEIVLVLPTLYAGIKTLRELYSKGDADSDKRILFDQLGHGWRRFEMLKETFQTATNVATGVSVLAGIISIFVPPAAAVASTAGIVATIGHTVVALMRLLSLGRIQSVIRSLPENVTRVERNVLKAQQARDVGGLVANLIGVLAGGLTGGYGQSSVISAGTTDAGKAAASTGIGQAFNTSQDMVGAVSEGHARTLEEADDRTRRSAMAMTPEEQAQTFREIERIATELQEITGPEQQEAVDMVSASSEPTPELEEIADTLSNLTGEIPALEETAATVESTDGDQTVDRDPTPSELASMERAETQMGGLDADEETTGETGGDASEVRKSKGTVQQSRAKGDVQFSKKGGRLRKWAKRKWDKAKAKFMQWLFKCLGIKEPSQQASQDVSRLKGLYSKAPGAATERASSATSLKSQADQLKDLASKR